MTLLVIEVPVLGELTHDTSLTLLLVTEVPLLTRRGLLKLLPVLGEVWTHDTSLTLLLVIEVPVLGEVWTHDTSLPCYLLLNYLLLK